MKHKNAAHTYKKQAIPLAGPIADGPLAINHIDQMILTDNLKFALCDTNEVFRVQSQVPKLAILPRTPSILLLIYLCL